MDRRERNRYPNKWIDGKGIDIQKMDRRERWKKNTLIDGKGLYRQIFGYTGKGNKKNRLIDGK